MSSTSQTYFFENLVCFRCRFSPGVRFARGLLIAIPLLNVGLLLLMFQWLHAAFIARPGVVVNLPAAPFAAGVPYRPMVLTVSPAGLIFFNDERLPSMEAVGPALRAAARAHPETTLVIEADERVTYHTMIELYNRALEAGLSRVALATRLPAAPGAGEPAP